MQLQEILFALFGLIAVCGALAVSIAGNVMRAAIGLLVNLLACAGIYLISGAYFLAAAQILVYVGGVLVLVMFGIMFTGKDIRNPSTRTVGGVIGALLFLALIVPVWMDFGYSAPKLPDYPALSGGTARLAFDMLTRYLLIFELIAAILLVALIASVLIASTPKTNEPTK